MYAISHVLEAHFAKCLIKFSLMRTKTVDAVKFDLWRDNARTWVIDVCMLRLHSDWHHSQIAIRILKTNIDSKNTKHSRRRMKSSKRSKISIMRIWSKHLFKSSKKFYRLVLQLNRIMRITMSKMYSSNLLRLMIQCRDSLKSLISIFSSFDLDNEQATKTLLKDDDDVVVIMKNFKYDVIDVHERYALNTISNRIELIVTVWSTSITL